MAALNWVSDFFLSFTIHHAVLAFLFFLFAETIFAIRHDYVVRRLIMKIQTDIQRDLEEMKRDIVEIKECARRKE